MAIKKQLMAEIMVEMTASAGYRKAISEMRKLQNSFSKQNFIYLHAPDIQTQDLLRDQGFKVKRTSIKEYIQFKVSWGD